MIIIFPRLAFYLGTLLNETGLIWLLDRVATEARVRATSPASVELELIRRSDESRTWLFVLNYSMQPVEVALERSGRDLITGETVDTSIVLGPASVAIIQSALS